AIGKWRQSVGACARDGCRDQPPLANDAEQRHAVRIVCAAQEIVDQARHEHGLAGTAQARHREGDRGAAGKLAEAEPLRGLREYRREPTQIQYRRHVELRHEYLRQLVDYRLDCVGSAELAGPRGYLMATDSQVLVVGAGPAGLFMAAELNRHGIFCRIVDKNDGARHATRAASIQARTVEILESIGLADELLQAGNICHAAATYTSEHKLIKHLTFDELDSAFPFVLLLPQSQTERTMARYLARLGTEVERRVELVAFEQDEDGVRTTLQYPDGGQETAHVSYLIACDGAHSPVRHALGVSFSGDDYPTDFMTADVQVDWKLPRDEQAFFFAAEGMLASFPLPRERAALIADIGLAQRDHPPLGEPALEDLQAIFNARTPGGVLSDPIWKV